jgi:hypothetical protein
VKSVHTPFLAYLPVPQLEQTRSLLALGATLSVSPGAQAFHALHALTLNVPLNVPAPQAEHTRFAMAVGLVLS